MKIQLIKLEDLCTNRESSVCDVRHEPRQRETGEEKLIGSRRVHYQRSGDMTV